MNGAKSKVVQKQLFVRIYDIYPSPENQTLYRPVTPDDPETISLADSIRENGIREPIVISADHYIISGHRRYVAARMAGLKEVPCYQLDVTRGDGEKADDAFIRMLRDYNRQRVKTRSELLNETILDINPDDEYRKLTAYRRKKTKVNVEAIEIREAQQRKGISPAKQEFLDAIKKIIREHRNFGPLNARQIHYKLLNDPPLIHASKPDSRYRNNKPSYRALIDLLTRARHDGWIDYDDIDDPTRPVTIWTADRTLADYHRRECDDFLKGYRRDLMQSQSCHVEIIGEKNTVQSTIEPVAFEFCVPLTIARGQCSTRPLYDIAERYKQSGKDKLIILAVSDCDPDGDAIAHSLGQRLRDDFDIREVAVIKTALTMKQVRTLKLPESYERAKPTSPNYRRYVDEYRTDCVWELEALDIDDLQRLVRDKIDGVIDRKAFNHEVTEERKDAVGNAAVREIVLKTLRQHMDL